MAPKTTAVDPVCGMEVDPATAVALEFGGEIYYFCERACADTFRDEPHRWLPVAPASHRHG